MERRSAARSTPRKRYTIDPFEGVAELQEVAAADSENDGEAGDEGEQGDDFHDAGGEPDDEDAMSVEDDPWDDDSGSDEHEPDNTITIVDEADLPRTGDVNAKFTNSLSKNARYKRDDKPESDKTYTRMLMDRAVKHVSKTERRSYFFGPAKEDYEPTQKAQMKWGYEPTLPSREADKNGFGGFHRTFYLTDEEYDRQAKSGWAWYYQGGGKDAFSQRQSFRQLGPSEASDYMNLPGASERSFLMGPYNEQRLYKLAVGQSMSLGDAWQNDSSTAISVQNYKSGFMLNLGARIRCLDWAPHCANDVQYLAVSVCTLRDAHGTPSDNYGSPAFTPQPAHKSAFQIWQFQSTEECYIDSKQPPKLVLALCTEWGDIKALKWCQAPREATDESELLAVISGDGALRIISVPLREATEGVEFIVEQIAFESKPPGTVCTCLTWIASNRIAVGCANGCIAVWDLPKCLATASPNARPTIYSSVSTSYIYSIDSCYPSRPDFVVTTSVMGYMILTDLRKPQPLSPYASAVSLRTRLAHRLLLWYDYAQVAIAPDDSWYLRGYAFRRWFASLGLGRTKSLAMSMAGSPCHPFILIGCANGDVVATNPVRRLIDSKVAIWQQTWFAHEWRRPTAAEVAADRQANADVAERVGKSGLSRITEGFKVERVLLHDDKGLHNTPDGMPYMTIYEESTAITALAWNPNMHVGGWAAAGMADGLLRVEDIAA